MRWAVISEYRDDVVFVPGLLTGIGAGFYRLHKLFCKYSENVPVTILL